MKTFVFLIAIAFFLPAGVDAAAYQQDHGSPVGDSLVVKKVLKAVRTHVLSATKSRKRPLVVKEGKKSRRFIVVNFLETVTHNKGVYTAEVDADEFDHKIPRILYVDVKASKGNYRVSRIRVGPNHFRETEQQR